MIGFSNNNIGASKNLYDQTHDQGSEVEFMDIIR